MRSLEVGEDNWDEENRLMNLRSMSGDIDTTTRGSREDRYVYDHAGERVVKNERLYGTKAYMNAYATIKRSSSHRTGSLSKHIYAGSQRIVTKLAEQEDKTWLIALSKLFRDWFWAA